MFDCKLPWCLNSLLRWANRFYYCMTARLECHQCGVIIMMTWQLSGVIISVIILYPVAPIKSFSILAVSLSTGATRRPIYTCRLWPNCDHLIPSVVRSTQPFKWLNLFRPISETEPKRNREDASSGHSRSVAWLIWTTRYRRQVLGWIVQATVFYCKTSSNV